MKRRRQASPEGRDSLQFVRHGALMGLIPRVDTGLATLVLFNPSPSDEANEGLGPENWWCLKL